MTLCRSSFGRSAALSLAFALAACAHDEQQADDVEQTPAAVTESDASEPAQSADASLADAAPYYPCSYYATIYRSEMKAHAVADPEPKKLVCLVEVDEHGASIGWTVNFGSDCKCAEPHVAVLPSGSRADAGL